MRITVSGKQLEIGKALKEYVEDRINSGVNKYFENAVDAAIVFSKEAHLLCADIMVNEGTGTGILIKGQGKADDIYAAFDLAADRIEKQLRRYKRRIKNHHKTSISELSEALPTAYTATKYVVSDSGEEIEEEGDNPVIIAEKQTKIETLTVSDAVMKMNLASLPALMFINKKNGAVNVVYRRNDGNISWVDSPLTSVSGKAKASAA